MSATPQTGDQERRGELKFTALANQLRHGIADGTWPPEAKLPTEREMSSAHQLSLTTIRRALDQLAEEGLVVRRQGSGTFVAPRLPATVSTRTIGVLVPSTTEYYPRVLSGVDVALSEASAKLLLACSHYDSREEDGDIASLLDSGVDGLLLVPDLIEIADPDARLEQLLDLPVPVVLLERRLPQRGPADRSEYVRTDHEGGAYDAVMHLAALGHEQIGLVCRDPNPTGFWVQRGYERAVADLGHPQSPRDIAPARDWSALRAEEALRVLQDGGASAALVFGDKEATWLEGAARRAGVRIPEDLALVAYDDERADVAEVPLTAVSPPKRALGRLGVEVLLRRIEQGERGPIHQIDLRPAIVIRDSCGASKVAAKEKS